MDPASKPGKQRWGIHLNLGGIRLNPGGIHLNPGGIHLNLGGIRLNPGGIRLNPGGIHLNLGGIHLNPGGIRLNPGGIQLPVLWNPAHTWRALPALCHVPKLVYPKYIPELGRVRVLSLVWCWTWGLQVGTSAELMSV
ncbi:hypothetical protein DUI87_28015 [Hirundo rustica rustica]|uniref:Uncharacterized protein n=1 Tax=Hirundo rustica rustica TaxID=333673 RepID=A0A3M0J399_HIRRU|nr:hypothetical protein DUI87_28015 [Hirundo rustica rustica]